MLSQLQHDGMPMIGTGKQAVEGYHRVVPLAHFENVSTLDR